MEPSLSPFELLEQDHQAVLARLELLQEALSGLKYERRGLLAKNLAAIQDVTDFLERTVLPHMTLEEQACFPYLEAHVPKLAGPIHILTMEHQDFRHKQRELKTVLQQVGANSSQCVPELLKQLEETGAYLVVLLRNHIRQEQEILFTVADNLLKPEEKMDLLSDIRRGQSSKFGDEQVP